MILTGADGQLRFGTNGVAKVRTWSLSIQRNAIDVTCLDTLDREYVSGVRNATGTATIWYDPEQTDDIALLNSIFQDRDAERGIENTETVTFVLNKLKGSGDKGTFKCECLVTDASPAVNVGEATAVNVSFQVTGPIEGGF